MKGACVLRSHQVKDRHDNHTRCVCNPWHVCNVPVFPDCDFFGFPKTQGPDRTAAMAP